MAHSLRPFSSRKPASHRALRAAFARHMMIKTPFGLV
jgi:hypothetical protein